MVPSPPRWTRAADFYAGRGIDAPQPLTEAEAADLQRRQDAADREVEKIYRLGQTRAA
jgi:hypothetical protein